jgi:hypothetical protein
MLHQQEDEEHGHRAQHVRQQKPLAGKAKQRSKPEPQNDSPEDAGQGQPMTGDATAISETRRNLERVFMSAKCADRLSVPGRGLVAPLRAIRDLLLCTGRPYGLIPHQ